VLKLQNTERPIPLLDYGLCANPHLVKVLQDITVVGTVRFLAVDPPVEEDSKLWLRCRPAPIVLVVEGNSYFLAQREDDRRQVGEEVVAHA
jgi:hypothetical protein